MALQEPHLSSEDKYIVFMYKFYFTTGLIQSIFSFFVLLDLIGISDFDYSNFYEVSYIFFIFSLIYFFFPFLFLVPFLSKLIRYGRKNKWLSLPLAVFVSQFLLIGLTDYSKVFLVPAFLCFAIYGIVGIIAGFYGMKQIKLHDKLTLNR